MEGHQVLPAIYQMNRVPELVAYKGQGAQVLWTTLHHSYRGSYATCPPLLILCAGSCYIQGTAGPSPSLCVLVELLQSRETEAKSIPGASSPGYLWA